MQIINQNTIPNDQPMWNDGRPHNCDESLVDSEVKLACGCMSPVVAGAVSGEGESRTADLGKTADVRCCNI